MRSLLCVCALSLSTFACGGGEPEPQTPAQTPAPIETTPAPVASQAPSAPEKTEAEKKAEQLAADRAKMTADHDKEMARFTPELRAGVKTLADKAYASPKAAWKAILASPHRQPDSAERDAQRHPQETLEFFGLKPTQQVLEYGPGGGWYTELLAPFLAKKGKLSVTNGDPKGPKEERSTYYAERVALLLQTAPELYGAVGVETIDGKAPKLTGSYDAILVMRGLHGMVNNDTLGAWLSAFHGALKPKGKLCIEQHRAAPNADVKEASKKGYLPQEWVIAEIEKAGFKLEAKSEINANPKDTKDYPEGVWALPPTLQRGDKDRAALAAIGESDRMTLRFVKKEKLGF